MNSNKLNDNLTRFYSVCHCIFFFFFLHAKDLFASQSCSQNQTGTINLSFSKELRLREIS